MANRQAISTTISNESARMVEGIIERTKITRSKIVDKAIQEYHKNWLKSEFDRMYKEETKEEREENLQLAEEGMADYWEIINRDEK